MPETNSQSRQSTVRWILLALLVSSILVNYIDRGALSVAIPAISQELTLDAWHKGILLSVFFWTYALMQIPAGWLADRIDVKWLYAGGYLVWTIATVMTGFVGGFATLIIARLILGLGESAAYPAISRLIVENYPEDERGLANSLIDAGTKIGPALSILAGGLLVDQFGWRALFIGLGVGGLIWLWPWIVYIPSAKHVATSDADDQPTNVETSKLSISQVLSERSVWGTSIGMFSLGYAWYFLLTWLPSYMMDHHGLDLKETAFKSALPFLAMAASTVAWGWMTDRMIRSGYSPTLARKLVSMTGLTLAAILLVAASRADSADGCITLLVICCCAFGMFTANVWAMTQSMAGPAAGVWTGIQNSIGNMGGVVSPLVAGGIVDSTGSYDSAFYVAGVVMLVGVAAYLFVVGKIEPINWHGEES